MFAKMKKNAIIAIILALAVISCASAAQIEPFASNTFYSRSATLASAPSGLSLTTITTTYEPQKQLGISVYVLYDQTAGSNHAYSVKNYTKGSSYNHSFDITNVIKGHTYYVKATFYADGNTYSMVTNSVRVR